MIDYNKTIGLPILTIKEGRELGQVRNFIIDTEKGIFLGFLLTEGFFDKDRVIRKDNIKKIGSDAIMVENEKSINLLKEIQLFKNVLDNKIKIKNNNVVTENGDKLGKVKNFEIDELSNKIANLYVTSGLLRDLIKGELIIAYNEIIFIGKDAIVVKDAIIKEKSKPVLEQMEKKEMETGIAISDQ